MVFGQRVVCSCAESVWKIIQALYVFYCGLSAACRAPASADYRSRPASARVYCHAHVPAKAIRVHLYSLSLVFLLWQRPHYRSSSLQADLIANLRNVCIPGTGLPLSAFARTRYHAWFFVLVVYPIVCFVAALLHSTLWIHSRGNASGSSGVSMANDPVWKTSDNGTHASIDEIFAKLLLSPDATWFHVWQLNCRLAALHAFVTNSSDYDMENKWTFVERVRSLNNQLSTDNATGERGIIPIPDTLGALAHLKRIVVKNKNEEGGLGIHIFSNVEQGGDWIFQELLENDTFVSSLLPPAAPLSTFRIVTAAIQPIADVGATSSTYPGDFFALTSVFRAGRQGAPTDHKSILLNVTERGVLGIGTTNGDWYNLGIRKSSKFWREFYTKTASTSWVAHPDDSTIVLAGRRVPDFDRMVNVCVDAHKRALPDVPFVGWDLALTSKGPLLLEANLSCNFFQGSFDHQLYIDIVDDYFSHLSVRLSACLFKAGDDGPNT